MLENFLRRFRRTSTDDELPPDLRVEVTSLADRQDNDLGSSLIYPNPDAGVLLKPTRLWPTALLLSSLSLVAIAVIAAILYRVDEAILVTGRLEPSGQSRSVQTPLPGIVDQLLVREGGQVRRGQPLLRFDNRELLQKIEALSASRRTVERELLTARAAIGQIPLDSVRDPVARRQAEDVLSTNRARVLEKQLEGRALQSQALATQQQQSLLEANIRLTQRTLQDLRPLVRQGAFSRNQVNQQEQTLNQQRIERSKLESTSRTLSDQILQNQLSSTALDGSLRQSLREQISSSQRSLSEIDTQLQDLRQSLRYKTLVAPIDGTVFDLQAQPGIYRDQTTVLLKIIPRQALVARVFITDRDIGFVRTGMAADVRIDAFPFTEFGDIKGTLKSIGSDSLPPDQMNQFYRFPAVIQLQKQSIRLGDRTINLQPGMAVSVNLKLRQRPLINSFTDLFADFFEKLKLIR